MRCVAASLCALTAFALTPQAHKPGDAAPDQKRISADVQRHFLAAQRAQARKDLATAESEYKQVLKLDPAFAEAHLNLGLMYQMDGRIPQAIGEFHAALKGKPGLTGANFFLGIDYVNRGEGALAVPYLEAAAEEQPKNIEVIYLIGQAYEHLGKMETTALKKAVPNSVRGEQLVAESYATSNDWPSAVIHFQNALAKAPNLPGLHVELGEVYLHAGKINEARVEFERELRRDPASVRSRARLGETKLFAGDQSGALKDLSLALAVDRVQVERVLGISESRLGDAASEQFPEELEKRLDAVAIELKGGDSPAARVAQAFLDAQKGSATTYSPAALPDRCTATVPSLLKQKRYSGLRPCLDHVPAALRLQVVAGLFAIGEYDAALRLMNALPAAQSVSPDVRYWRARCYEKLATEAYVALYESDPNSYRVHELLGDLASTRGDDAKAIEEYRAAVTLSPNSPNLHYKLGHILWKDMSVPEAREQLQEELNANPSHSGALDDMGDTYLLQHQPDKALLYLQRALQADQNDPGIHRDLGTAYMQLSQYAKAESEYKLAIPGDHDGSVHYKLAKVYQALGQKANADREFSIFKSMNRDVHEKLEEKGQRVSDVSRVSE